MPGRGRRGEQEHVPGPTVSTLRVGIVFVNLCSVTEAVAVLVHSIRQFIVQRDPINTEFRKPVKLVRFRDAVVVGVDPQTKLGVDRVAAVDDAVSVTAIFRLVEYRQRQKAMGSSDGGWGVTSPNSSAPSLILPSPFLSKARKAFVEPGAVQLIWVG